MLCKTSCVHLEMPIVMNSLDGLLMQASPKHCWSSSIHVTTKESFRFLMNRSCSDFCVEKVSVAIPADLWYVFVLQGGEAYARNTDSPVVGLQYILDNYVWQTYNDKFTRFLVFKKVDAYGIIAERKIVLFLCFLSPQNWYARAEKTTCVSAPTVKYPKPKLRETLPAWHRWMFTGNRAESVSMTTRLNRVARDKRLLKSTDFRGLFLMLCLLRHRIWRQLQIQRCRFAREIGSCI